MEKPLTKPFNWSCLLNNIILWDLETFGFDFKGDKSFILCGSYKRLGEPKVHTIQRRNLKAAPWDDKSVCSQLYTVLAKADGFITHNGTRFDVPLLNTRLMKHGLPFLPPKIQHFDTCKVIWKKLSMRGKLDSVQKFLHLRVAKTPLNLETWTMAGFGHRPSMAKVVEHCEHDVRVLEAVYLKLRGLGYTHFNRAVLVEKEGVCPICGIEGPLQKRGFNLAQVTKAQRYQCQECRGWSSGKPIRIKGLETRI